MKPNHRIKQNNPVMAFSIEQLQREVTDPTINVGTILQRAILIANEYKDQRFVDWARRELNGYENTDNEDAEYRKLKGEYVVITSDGRTQPIVWEKDDPKMRRRFITLPIAEMEAFLSGDGEKFAVRIEVDPRSMTSMDLQPSDRIGFSLGRATLLGFLHAVKQRVLDWTMTLKVPPPSPQDIRLSILQVIDRLQRDSSNYLDDSAIADELKLNIQEIRGHLGILEREGRIKLNKTMRGHGAGFDSTQRQLFRESLESPSKKEAVTNQRRQDAESLRAFRDALRDFTNYAKEVEEADVEKKSSPEFIERRNHLIDSIKKHRRPALLAGVHAGETLERMTEILDHCIKECIEHKRVSTAAPPVAYARLVARIVRDLQSIEDLIALVESREAEKENDPARQVTAFNLPDPSMLRTLVGLFPSDGSIAWQLFGHATPDECDGSPASVRLSWTGGAAASVTNSCGEMSGKQIFLD